MISPDRRLAIVEDIEQYPGDTLGVTRVVMEVRCDGCGHWSQRPHDGAGLDARICDVLGIPREPGWGCASFLPIRFFPKTTELPLVTEKGQNNALSG